MHQVIEDNEIYPYKKNLVAIHCFVCSCYCHSQHMRESRTYFDYFVLVMLQRGVTPDPIPNSAVKPSLAYDTWTQSGPGKVGCRQHEAIKLVWPSLASMIPNPVSFLGKVGCRQHKVIKLVLPSLASMIPNPVSFLGKVGCRQH